MNDIVFYFQVHQPYRLKRYRFFDIGNDTRYLDYSANRTILNRVAATCYLPANKLLARLIRKHKGAFKVSFSISGAALEQLSSYAPAVLASFRELHSTGCVEFLAETYYHSLASLVDTSDFENQVSLHRHTLKQLLGADTPVFRNTELVYSDLVGARVAKMGFTGMLIEGVPGIVGSQPSGTMYVNPYAPALRLLPRSCSLSEDISLRFSNRSWGEWPLTVEKYVRWLSEAAKSGNEVGIYMDYEALGYYHRASSGIFDFVELLPSAILRNSEFNFTTPSEVISRCTSFEPLHVQKNTSWAAEARDLSPWLGNRMQDDAFKKLYSLSDKVSAVGSPEVAQVFGQLQASDHFYYMRAAEGTAARINHYGSPYEAFIAFMNVLTDFERRLDQLLEEKNADRALPVVG